MLLRSSRRIGQAEKGLLKANECGFDSFVFRLKVLAEGFFQRVVFPVPGLQKLKKIKRIYGIECPVLKRSESFALGGRMVYDKVMRAPLHKVNELQPFIDDRLPSPPGKDRHPEGYNFNILKGVELMGKRNGVFSDKSRLLVLRCFFV